MPKFEELPLEDRWILSRLASTTASVTDSLEGYHFSEAARTIYEFIWSEFCDWYIEMAKGRLTADGRARLTVQRVLVPCSTASCGWCSRSCRSWPSRSGRCSMNSHRVEAHPNPQQAAESVMIAPWPAYPASLVDEAMETRIALMQELVRGIRQVRNRYVIDNKTSLDVAVRCDAKTATDFGSLAPFIGLLAGVGKLDANPSVKKPPQAVTQVHPMFETYVSLQGLIDPTAEVKRLEKQIAEKTKSLETTRKKLENADFVKRAPAEVVEQQRDQDSWIWKSRFRF